MSSDYKTLRVPEDAWETAKEQKESAGRTWGEQVVRPDSDKHTTTDVDLDELEDRIVVRIAREMEADIGTLEGKLDDLESQMPRKVAQELQ